MEAVPIGRVVVEKRSGPINSVRYRSTEDRCRGRQGRYIERRSHFTGRYAQVFRHFRQSRLSALERETEPVDRNKPIFRAISYRPR